MNSIGKLNRSTLKRRNCGELQEDSNVPTKRILRSTHVMGQVLNNYERNTSVSLFGIRKNNKKLSMIKTSNVNINNKAILKYDVQSRIFKSDGHCNLCDDNEINQKQNTKFQQENLFTYKTNLSQQKSLKAKLHKNINQSSATNIQNLTIDSNRERDHTISIQTRRKGSCKINKSITTEESNKFHLQISFAKGQGQKNMDRTVRKYKKCNEKTKKKKYSKRTMEKVNTNNSPIVTTVRASKINTKTNKNVAMDRNCTGNKRLIIPLIKIDDFPSSELSKLIRQPNFVQVKQNIQANRNVYFETENITGTQCSTYKQYRTTNLKQDEEINVLYKSVFERRYTEFKDHEKEEIDANIKLETNTYKMSLENKVNTTEILQGNACKLGSTNLSENILELFLKNKRNITNIKTRQKSKIETCLKKSVAMCSKCAEIFNLLRQFSGKINFVQNEKLCIECTLCNVQINSLFHFQQHVMDIHLQCEGKSLARNKKFPVVIINFSEQVDVDKSSQFIFECCCCSRIFDRATNFEEHIKNMHYTSDVKKCKSKQIAKSSELRTTFQNEQVLDETCVLNKHYVFDTSTNADEISSQITKENSEIIENIRKLNIDEKYANSISEIAVTSKSELSNMPNIKINQRFKAYQRHKRYPFICDICFKKYKRKHMFLSHISKHGTKNSDTDVREQQKTQETNNLITFDNNLILNSKIKTSQECINTFKDDNTSNSTVNLKELSQNTLISKIIDKKVNSFENTNMKCVEEDSISNKIDDYSYLLHVNLTQKTEEGMKRQKLIKFNINVAKKYKTSISEQQNIENRIENKGPKGFTTNSSFAMDVSKKNVNGLKKLQCNICDKKFNSLTILKEHMFILHDSLFEDPELSNLPTIPPTINDNRKIQNLSTRDIYTSKEKHDLLHKMQTPKKILQNDDKHGKKGVYQTFNADKKKNRKWRCSPCKENFALLRNYLRHKYYCHNDESVVHICDNCNKILTSVAMVNIHMCTNVISWICKRCNFNFSSSVSLTKHNMNCHLEKVGPHVCKICKLSFLTAYMLTKHEATHSK
ncbi:hypothetical protein QLX08_008166 [Tetragonisca angustula]|uniref:C2H2-type domain-containing protein n=2 Tax=Tetragonisca angustula TaxID=166442 RepID=A0AAW0ZLZ3_9HYME